MKINIHKNTWLCTPSVTVTNGLNTAYEIYFDGGILAWYSIDTYHVQCPAKYKEAYSNA